jgi:CubicO group peptidase (beta-lactamase class C family)
MQHWRGMLFGFGLLSVAGMAGEPLPGSGGLDPVAVFPGQSWEHVPPADVDANTSRKMEALRGALRAGDTTAMLVIVHGRILFEQGNPAEVSYVASARKSVISMLYGKYVADGTIRLDQTLRDLGLDDEPPLLPEEREARVGDLLRARSGVYHKAANLGDASDLAPARGTVKPGAYFLYNNWDFNALGAILEQRTGKSPYMLFTEDIADPLDLEDWDRAPGAYAGYIRNDTKLSRFPAHHFLLSTRDMARVGYLMLRQGRWRERQVIPADWVQRSTRLHTPASEVARTSPFIAGLGYGYLWWIFDPGEHPGSPLAGAYTASGAFGQYVTVVPRLDMVIAHKVAVPPPRNVTNETYFQKILPLAVALVDSPAPNGARASARKIR